MRDVFLHKTQRLTLVLLGIIALFFIVISLKNAASIFLPVIIAVFLPLVLNPIINVFNRVLRIPRIVGILICITCIGALIYFIVKMMFGSIKALFSVYPRYEARFTSIYKELSSIFDFSFDEELSLFQNLWQQLRVRVMVQNAAFSFSSAFIKFCKDLIMVLIIAGFLLMEFSLFRKKIEYIFPNGKSGAIKRILGSIIHQISKFLSIKFFISLLTGALIFAGFSFIRVDFALLWAVVSFAANFIPNIGSIAVGICAAAFAMLQFWPEPAPVFAVAAYMLSVNMILGNIVEPRIQGANLGLSPFIIVASLLFWGWLWGFAGLILGVPMMVVLKIICENVSILEPVSVLMGSERKKTDKSSFSQADSGGSSPNGGIPLNDNAER